MKTLAAFLLLAAIAPAARGEEVWRWKDANGNLCYSNRTDVTPPDARPVKTRLIIEADRLPGAPDLVPNLVPNLVMDRGQVVEAHHRRFEARPLRRRPRIYTEARLRFDCYASNVLYAGGWSHPDDITVQGNCLPYLLGPEAWLNGARAELALRQNGIDWREVVRMYAAESTPDLPRRVTTVSALD